MAKAEQYGGRYWCITGEGEPLFIHADRIEVSASGALVAWGGWRSKDAELPEETPIALYAIAAGQWHTFYAASLITGEMVCADEQS